LQPYEAPNRIARLQSAQLALYRLQKREAVGENVIIDRTIVEIEVSRLIARANPQRLMFAL
jgi:hypothetical protein